MTRSLFTAIFLLLASAVPTVHGQQWAVKMFKKTSHDFGVVAKGSKAEYAFEFQNIYEEDLHIADVRTSCGCTSASITKQDLKTWETSSILATFNTRSFDGKRGATLTVIIDRPFYAEVSLRVDGFIRRDVVFEPGQVEFGEVDQGKGLEKTVRVTYAGRSNWKIVDVRSANEHFEVELNELQRGNGRVSYDMLVRLKGDAPAGYLEDQLSIITDETSGATLTLPVVGRVVPPISVSPALLTLGTVKPGQSITKQLVVRGKTPFKVTHVKCPDGCFEFKVPGDAKTLHLIPVTFTAGAAGDKIEQKIEIETDLGNGVKACCTATATVAGRRAEPAAKTESSEADSADADGQ